MFCDSFSHPKRCTSESHEGSTFRDNLGDSDEETYFMNNLPKIVNVATSCIHLSSYFLIIAFKPTLVVLFKQTHPVNSCFIPCGNLKE